jgi:hypothetical protein
MEHERERMKQRMLAAPVIRKKIIEKTEEKPNIVFHSNSHKPLNRLLFEIIKMLKVTLTTLTKEQTKPVDQNEIVRRTAIDVDGTEGLKEALLSNARVIYDTQAETYQYQVIIIVYSGIIIVYSGMTLSDQGYLPY